MEHESEGTITASRDAQGRLVLRGDEGLCQLLRTAMEALGRDVVIEKQEGEKG